LEGTRAPSNLPAAESKALINKYGADNWYDWNRKNWGTKWNSYDGDIDHDTNTIEFCTAWTLPDPIFAEMAKLYPDLHFHIETLEEGGFFAGYIDIKNGEVDERLSDVYEVWKCYARSLLGSVFEEDEEDEEHPVLEKLKEIESLIKASGDEPNQEILQLCDELIAQLK
jgi:hypothetical protein